MPEKLKVVVTDSSVKVPKLHTIANVVQYDREGTMPREELLAATKDADAIFCLLRDKIDKEFLENAKKLKIVATMSVGYDHVDIEECRKRNIKVGNTPDVLTEATAELGVALLLTTARRLPEAIHCAREGKAPVWTPYWMCGKAIRGSTIGLYGCGRIGESMAEKLAPFNPKRIIYHNRKPKSDTKLEYVSFEDLLKESDFLIITVAQTKETIGKFNKETLGKMKNGAILINTSRGGLVKMMDLYEALKSGHLFAAGLDVTDPEPLPIDHPLFTLDNCVILPHIGSATYDARNAMVQLTEENIYSALLGKEMAAAV